MRVFVTGVSGYLGGVLARRLAQAPDIKGITGIDTAMPPSALPGRIRFVRMDIRSPDLAAALAGHTVLVHTAFVVLWSSRMPRAVRDDINLNGVTGCDPRLQFVHEDDVAAAFLQAVRLPMPGAYNVVADDWLRWRWLGSPFHPSWLDAILLDFTASNGKLRSTGWRPRYRSKAALRAAR